MVYPVLVVLWLVLARLQSFCVQRWLRRSLSLVAAMVLLYLGHSLGAWLGLALPINVLTLAVAATLGPWGLAVVAVFNYLLL